jgi:sugar fermentation stimulation protein A
VTNKLYVVVAWAPHGEQVAVGALGSLAVARGWYAYVGSAERARETRVARHLAADKTLRWHADYFFRSFPARSGWLVDTGLSECELTDGLARLPGAERRLPRFGAGDCLCAGHLVRLGRRPRRADLRRAAGDGAAVRAFSPHRRRA